MAMKINASETQTPTTIGMSCFSITGHHVWDFTFSLNETGYVLPNHYSSVWPNFINDQKTS